MQLVSFWNDSIGCTFLKNQRRKKQKYFQLQDSMAMRTYKYSRSRKRIQHYSVDRATSYFKISFHSIRSSKMELLKACKRVLSILFIFPEDDKRNSYISKFFRLLLVTIQYGMLYMSLAFLLIDAQTVNDFTVALYSLSVSILYAMVYTVLIRGNHLLFKMIADSEKFVESREYPISIESLTIFNFKFIAIVFNWTKISNIVLVDRSGNRADSKSIYEEVELKSGNFCRKLLIGTFFTCSGVFVMPFAVPFMSFCSGTYSTDVWFLPYPAT